MTVTNYKRNDRLPIYTATLVQQLDCVTTPIDLTGTTVSFIMRHPSSSAPKVKTAATIVDGEAGEVSYAWADGDLDTLGTFRCEWEITYPDGRTLTVPSSGYDQIRVLADLDT